MSRGRRRLDINSLLASDKTILLDGATGTLLENRRYKTKAPLWTASANFDIPKWIQETHVAYIEAGANIITANTFRTTGWTYQKVGKRKLAQEATSSAIAIATRAVKQGGKNTLIAGSVAPLEDCYRPDLVPALPILEQEHSEQIHLLQQLGVDLIIAETINTIREAKIIASICNNLNIPFFLSFVTNGKGQLLSEEPLKLIPEAISSCYPLVILLNCRPLKEITNDLLILKKFWKGCTGIYANGPGHPCDQLGWQLDKHNPIGHYVNFAKKWQGMGVQVIGGCCGTTPDFIWRLKQELVSFK